MERIEWLTLGLLLVTGIYAWLTHKIHRSNQAAVEAMREQAASQLRPYVQISVFARPGAGMLYLAVRNVGRSGAEKLRLTLDREFYQLAEKADHRKLSSRFAFAQEIACLPPTGEFIFLLGTGPSIFGKGVDPDVAPQLFTVSAQYGWNTARYSEATPIDLRPYLLSDITHHPIAEELEKVRESIDKLRSSLEKRSN